MEITIKARCDVPSRTRQAALQRIRHAARFLDRLQAVEVVFATEGVGRPALVELTGRTKRERIRVEGRGADHRAAVDVAVARFERQLARHKARTLTRARRRATRPALTGAALPAAPPAVATRPAAAPAGAWPDPRFARTTTAAVPPMLPDEAAVQLELLGADVLVFRNAATDRCSVVYRLAGGDLGLVETVDAALPPG